MDDDDQTMTIVWSLCVYHFNLFNCAAILSFELDPLLSIVFVLYTDPQHRCARGGSDSQDEEELSR